VPRPTKPLISRDGTAAVALRLIDDEGLTALSLERLAQAMGVKAPSLYHHFGDKADILAEVALIMYLETPVPRMPPVEAWREWHLQMSVNRYKSIMGHHRAASLLLSFRPRHVVLPVYERSAKIMSFAGVPERLQVTVMDALEKLTFGSAILDAAAIEENVATFPDFDREKYPYVSTAINEGYTHGDYTFAQTIWMLLRGFPDELSGDVPMEPNQEHLEFLQRRR
jgi:TetR/AcrR family transcriptional regulator, tetracycline repressor protein